MLSLLIKAALLCLAVEVCETTWGYPLDDLDSERATTAGQEVILDLMANPVEAQPDLVLTLLKREVSAGGFADENPDDLELAEINVFRPVFRYRLALSKRLPGPPQF